jgi:hypothetical protein
VKVVSPQTRYAALLLLVALLASLVVAAFRFQIESHSRHVEIAMDYNEFSQFARAYNYNQESLLIALRRAGLTSLGLSEELGADLPSSDHASVLSGSQLTAAAHLAPIADPTLAALVRSGKARADTLYITVNDPTTYARYRAMLPLHFDPSAVKIVRATRPWIVAVRTQLDYFGSVSLGIPEEQLALARRLGLEIIPRFQNDESYGPTQMQALVNSLHGDRRVSDWVFFGLRNQAVGFPDHIKDMADIFKQHRYSLGSIEIYDDSQLQKGSDELAKLIPGQTVRVQAIAKNELDKLRFDEIVSRFVLGVRERNIRVVYLRPYLHQETGSNLAHTNIDLVKQIADELSDNGFLSGRASPIPLYRGNGLILVGLACLAVPSIFVLLLGVFGWYRRWLGIVAYALTVGLYVAGVALHHDMFVRSVLALLAALLFSAAAFLVLAPAFSEEPAASTRAQTVRSLKWTLLVTGVALLGALAVVGIMSSPLAMEEIERVRGVKLILTLPPLIALALYVFSGRYNTRTNSAGDVLIEPVRAYQLLVLALVGGAAALLVMRSGNQSDIAPSGIELSVRHGLTQLLNVRPRFKEFLVGVPILMLAPALLPVHRRAVGWLLALGIGVGIGDVIDTFSHLHTTLGVSLLRIFNGVVLGVLIGVVAILVYRAVLRRVARES